MTPAAAPWTNALTLGGWAIDPRTANPTNVVMTVDGHDVTTGAANVSRPDVARPIPASARCTASR